MIYQLKHGNLKARLRIKNHDEFGRIMARFNEMADEIETLVKFLRKAESTRKGLLQELAHDLRTPIASLKNLISTIDSHHERLSLEERNRIMSLAVSEIKYFEDLVEDLLFLGQVSDPQYKKIEENFSLKDLADSELRAVTEKYPHIKPQLESLDFIEETEGDVQLVRRLLRNGLENAFSFAKESVKVTLEKPRADRVKIKIQDDGQGFDEESLNSFGERKFSRKQTYAAHGRISIGLGAVIMKSITEAFRGHIKPSNQTTESGQVQGATLEIELELPEANT